MKLTKSQLKKIIREEKQKLQESFYRPSDAMIRARNEEPDPMEAMRANQAKRDQLPFDGSRIKPPMNKSEAEDLLHDALLAVEMHLSLDEIEAIVAQLY